MNDDAPDDHYDQRVSAAVAAIVSSRGHIDQTKGMLMVVFAIGSDEAFELLRTQARRTRTDLKALARQFLDDVAALDYRDGIPNRATFEELLLSAHTRLADAQLGT